MKKTTLHNTIPKPPKTVLVGLTLPSQKAAATKEHLEELAALAFTAEMEVVKTFTQKLSHGNAATMIGKGKVAEIATFVEKHEIAYVIFDDELTPLQAKNLEKACKCAVWDRSLLILTIFAMHARTRQAKAQIELAQYQYLLPRLRGMWTHLSRQQGGTGMRGPGEKELETDKRVAQDKIRLLKKKLTHMEQVGQTQRKQRKGKVNVALVGYTNAGKSTLMQHLAKENLEVADKLFVTLSPTVRKVFLQDLSFLLADTVGFVRKLPHTLVECFRSTLAEVREADLLLHVVDCSHPSYQQHIDTVHHVLQEIGAAHIPMILVLNKQDRIAGFALNNAIDAQNSEKIIFFAAEKERLATLYKKHTLYCSAIYQDSLVTLRKVLHQEVSKLQQLLFPNRYPQSPRTS